MYHRQLFRPESKDTLSIETTSVGTSEQHGKYLVAWGAVPLTKGQLYITNNNIRFK